MEAIDIVNALSKPQEKPITAQVLRLQGGGAVIRVGNKEVQASLYSKEIQPGMRAVVLKQGGGYMVIAPGPKNNELRNQRIING